MNKSTGPPLPQEIYDTIIDYLRDDKKALNACSLVASTWRPTSQKLLHRSIVFHATLPPLVDGQSSAESPVVGSEKARLLLDASFHILQYACSFVICGERVLPRPQRRVPDPSLADLLTHISTLALPSLASVELRHLRWAEITPGLQRALVLLLSGASSKDVILADCDIPLGVEWLRFVGPETRSLKLIEVRLFDDPSVDHGIPINDLPVSSAPNLISLNIGQVYSIQMIDWFLYPLKKSSQLNPRTAASPGPSFCQRVATLSLSYQYFSRSSGLHELVQAFTHLKTLIYDPPGSDITFSLDKVICIPTFKELRIRLVTAGQLSWLFWSFATISSHRLPLTYTRATDRKPVSVHIDMWLDPEPNASLVTPITYPELLVKIQAFDELLASTPNVEVTLTMSIPTLELGGGSENVEKTKTTLEGWRADLKALKLEVSRR